MKKTFSDDDLDDIIEEEAIHPEKSDAKKRKIVNAVSNERNDFDSDDDLPEVFTMTEGKSMVQQRRNDEKTSSKRIAEDARKRKQERAEKGKENKKSKRKDVTASVDPAMETIVPSKITGLLDDNIVQFLSTRESNKLENMNLEPSIRMKMNVKKSSKNRRKREDSRVQVIVLNKGLQRSAQNSAMKFKQEHLYGKRLKRDFSMLKH